jgi:hypothetical protein
VSFSDALTGNGAARETEDVPLRTMLFSAALLAAAAVGGGFFDGHFL